MANNRAKLGNEAQNVVVAVHNSILPENEGLGKWLNDHYRGLQRFQFSEGFDMPRNGIHTLMVMVMVEITVYLRA
jgi:hypothetical protein